MKAWVLKDGLIVSTVGLCLLQSRLSNSKWKSLIRIMEVEVKGFARFET